SLMRSSSVWLVLSTGCAYQASLAVDLAFIVGSSRGSKSNEGNGQKKTAGVRRFGEGSFALFLGTLGNLSTASGREMPKVAKKIRAGRMHGTQFSTSANARSRPCGRFSFFQRRSFFHH
ncbi:MAG TPA: hypothetical protein VK996_20010, partial [Ramlibacter sp.]|nr:hypothetical protein [Ramlibacter sp.]